MARFGTEVIPAVLLAGSTMVGNVGATNPAVPEVCFVSGDIAGSLPTPEEAKLTVAGIEFALSAEQAEGYRDKLLLANMIPEVEAVLESALDPYDIEVEVGSVPPMKPSAAQLSHQPEEVETGAFRDYALDQLDVMLDTPVRKMEAQRGQTVYYTSDLKVNGRASAGAAVDHGQTTNDQEAIVYNLDLDSLRQQPFNNTPREIIEHEALGHGVVRHTCDLGDADAAFVGFNPQGFEYSEDQATMDRAVKGKVIVFGYPVNDDAGEDMALTYQELITNGFRRCQEDGAEIICGKLMLMAARDAYAYGDEMLALYVSLTEQASVVETRNN